MLRTPAYMGPIPNPRHQKSGRKGTRRRIEQLAEHTNTPRLTVVLETNLGAPTDDVAVLPGGGRQRCVRYGRGRRGAGGGGAQIGPGRHGSGHRMFRLRAPPRATATGEPGRLEGAGRGEARVWRLGANGGIFELGVRRGGSSQRSGCGEKRGEGRR